MSLPLTGAGKSGPSSPPDPGSTCALAITISKNVGEELSGTITSTGETWYILDGGTANSVDIPSGVSGESYQSATCGSLVFTPLTAGPAVIELDKPCLFRIVGTPGASYTLTFTEI